MDKDLIKIYVAFIILLVLSAYIFPYIFQNTYNNINNFITKTISIFNDDNTEEINIYEDRGNVILMFDDGWESQYTVAYDYMNTKKIRGCIGVITKAIGQKYYMNYSELYKLYNKNWDLFNHTHSHKNLNKIDEEEQSYEIKTADIWLDKNGFINPNKVLIYPEGGHNLKTYEILKEMNYISGRGIEEGFNEKKPTNLFDIKVKSVLSNTNPNDIIDWINYTIDNNFTLIILFHRIEDNEGDSLFMYNKEDFYKVIDYIDKRRNDLNVITYSEWILTTIN
jgi:peptidoglycan/xylan/chitin deacetylase (PgdA/CDA1 family)